MLLPTFSFLLRRAFFAAAHLFSSLSLCLCGSNHLPGVGQHAGEGGGGHGEGAAEEDLGGLAPHAPLEIPVAGGNASLPGREEAQVGQRTTLDVLNAQQALLNARVNLVISQRDRIVASYAALGAIGRLSAGELKLAVIVYDPTEHFEQVKDKWFGLDTPGGR